MKTEHIQKQLDFFVRDKAHHAYRKPAEDAHALAEKLAAQGLDDMQRSVARLRYVLEQVVSEGSGKKAKLEGYRIGGKTATSEKLPRSLKKYISSFIGFAPADNPQVMALITIDEPEGIYYGGTIAAPVVGDLFKNILPYLGIEAVQEETAVHLSNP